MLGGEHGARSGAANAARVLARRPRFAIHREATAGRCVLAPTGELDIATAPLLEEAAERACAEQARQLVLDMRRLAFIDAGGLRAVSATRVLCEHRGLEFRIVFGGGQVERLFQLAGILDALPFHPGEVRAVRSADRD